MKDRVLHKIITDEASMLALGAELASVCGDGLVFFLYGQLGAGKTTFARGFLRGLGYVGKVKSPTYTLVEPYELINKNVYHFDFYRVRDPAELEFMGIRDYLTSRSICLIEWPEYGEGILPVADVSCYIDIQNSQREIKLVAHTPIGTTMLERLRYEK